MAANTSSKVCRPLTSPAAPGNRTQRGNPLRKRVGELLYMRVDGIEECMELNEVAALHVPVRLFCLSL